MNADRPLPSELDPAVIRRAIVDGFRPAFTQLYRHYEGKVRYGVARAAMKKGRSKDIEDLIQEVWCRLMSNDRRLLSHYKPDRGRFGPFVGWVAYQQTLYVIDLQRHKAPIDGLPGDGESLMDEEATRFVSEVFQRDFFQKLLEQVDAELAVEDRVLLREHYLDGRTLREVAEDLGVTEDAIYQRNHRLKKKLSRIIELLQSPPASTSEPRAAVMTLVAVALLMQPRGDERGQECRGFDAFSSLPDQIH